MLRRMQHVKVSKDSDSDASGSVGSGGSSHSPTSNKKSGPIDNMSSKSSSKFSSDSLTTEIEDKEEYTKEELGKTTFFGGNLLNNAGPSPPP